MSLGLALQNAFKYELTSNLWFAEGRLVSSACSGLDIWGTCPDPHVQAATFSVETGKIYHYSGGFTGLMMLWKLVLQAGLISL